MSHSIRKKRPLVIAIILPITLCVLLSYPTTSGPSFYENARSDPAPQALSGGSRPPAGPHPRRQLPGRRPAAVGAPANAHVPGRPAGVGRIDHGDGAGRRAVPPIQVDFARVTREQQRAPFLAVARVYDPALRAIEFVLEGQRGYVAFYAPTLTQEDDRLALHKKELLKKLPLSRHYLRRNMQLILEDNFQLEPGEAGQLLQQAEEELARFIDRNTAVQSARLMVERERLQRKVEFKAQLYATLQTQVTQAELELQQSKPVITAMEDPVPPLRPASSRAPFKFFVSVIFGVLAGIALAFMARYAAEGDWRARTVTALQEARMVPRYAANALFGLAHDPPGPSPSLPSSGRRDGTIAGAPPGLNNPA